MATALDTEQVLLISRARQGNPQAIAALLQRDLQQAGVEVCAWKRGRTLRLELMSPVFVGRSEALTFIRRGVDYLQPEDVDAVHLSLYLNDEHEPRWVERIGLRQNLSIKSSGTGGHEERNEQARRGRWPKPLGLAIATFVALVGIFLVTTLADDGIQPSSAKTQQTNEP